MERWAAFPTWWVRSGMLKNLNAAADTTGAHVAALKVYLAIAISADFFDLSAEVSVTRLELLTDLSRPMVTRAIKLLEEMGVLSVDRSGYRNVYRLLQAEDQKHWMRIPVSVARLRLKELPNGTAVGLAALKLYLVLLTVRPRGSHQTPISHRKLQKYTGVRPNMISRGLSLLAIHGLMRYASEAAYKDAAGHPVNTYYLMGVLGDNDVIEDVAAGSVRETDHYGPELPAEPELEPMPAVG
jgi:DNA-binding transcriptional ArsR family regulator